MSLEITLTVPLTPFPQQSYYVIADPVPSHLTSFHFVKLSLMLDVEKIIFINSSSMFIYAEV